MVVVMVVLMFMFVMLVFVPGGFGFDSQSEFDPRVKYFFLLAKVVLVPGKELTQY